MPLRNVSALFKEAFQIFKQHATLLLGIALAPALVIVVAGLLYPDFFHSSSFLQRETPQGPDLIASIALAFAMTITTILSAIALIRTIAQPTNVTVLSAYKDSLPHFFSYIWVSILVGIAVLLGFVALIIPGLIALVWFTFSNYVLLLEGKKGMAALKASREYVRGRWIEVFTRLAMLVLAIIGASIIAGIILSILFIPRSAVEIILDIAGVAVGPYSMIYVYLIYTDLKAAKLGAIAQPTD